MQTLTIIGCGNVGKSLGRLWQLNQHFQINGILNRTLESAQAAVEWIGAGSACEHFSQLTTSNLYLIATGDDAIESTANKLAASGVLKVGDIVFHTSGALSSEVLSAVKSAGAFTASIHPVKSFASPCASLADFAGTFCGCEGDTQALSVLKPAFEAIGAQTFDVGASQKSLYHAASVISCNYLTALIELSAQAYEKAGIPRETAMQIMQPIVEGTVTNIFSKGTVDALTGPIARGDANTVEKQLESIQSWNADYAETYKVLGKVAVSLSQKQGNASEDSLQRIAEVLGEDESVKA